MENKYYKIRKLEAMVKDLLVQDKGRATKSEEEEMTKI